MQGTFIDHVWSMCQSDIPCSFSSAQTVVRTIQFLLCLRYDMYNKDSTRLYLDVWKHVWVVFHGKPKNLYRGHNSLCRG
jgi:hypothetical protein